MKAEITLRPYQSEAINKAKWALDNLEQNSLIVSAQGSGKSIIQAGIVDSYGKETLILQPSKELLAQNRAKLALYVDSKDIGTYSASFSLKDIKKYTYATIQSIYKTPALFKHFNLVLIDEADLVNPRNKKGMFTSFLEAIGNPTTIGLTATPYRNMTGYTNVNGILTAGTCLKLINRINPRIWQRIIFNKGAGELINEGYLSRLAYHSRTPFTQLQIPLNRSRSDFDLDAYERMLLPEEANIIDSINLARKHRRAVLVFCSTVAQAKRMSSVVKRSAYINALTPAKERDKLLLDFYNGDIEVMFNQGILTTGYDLPHLDCIYMLRPTRSLRLWNQMAGRGTRLAKDKSKCDILDYAGNFTSMGGIEDIKLVKEKLWELYAKGERVHGKEIFSWSVK
jgi:DNA repair protein RadD